eukprot:9489302-Pyramimonas_sp.AAC.2
MSQPPGEGGEPPWAPYLGLYGAGPPGLDGGAGASAPVGAAGALTAGAAGVQTPGATGVLGGGALPAGPSAQLPPQFSGMPCSLTTTPTTT